MIGQAKTVVPPSPGPSERSANMRAIQRRDTSPELALRSALHRRGYRFRVDYPVKVSGRSPRPDIVFTRQRLAVFVDGCFWHGCPEHGHTPKKNTSYWGAKLTRNVERDREQDRMLGDAGWTVIRIWDHEDPETALKRVEEALGR